MARRQELFHVFEFPGVGGIFGISSLRCGVDRPLSHASLPEKRKRSRPSQCVTLSLSLSLSLSHSKSHSSAIISICRRRSSCER